MSSLLDDLEKPEKIKKYSLNVLKQLACEIRKFIIDSVSKTGGHIGTSLGVVELTIALHYVFNMPIDKIIFDTGHQGYTHKLLTGRKSLFKTLNQLNGMSRFLSREESEYDLIDTSHGGTAISIATGMALKKNLDNEPGHVVAIVGDGALVEGMSAEGLNYGVAQKMPLIIILNDNGMSIPVNVGGIKNLTSGKDWDEKSKSYFEGFGYKYIAVKDGHNINSLVNSFKKAIELNRNGAVIVHVKTEKGRGLEIAKKHKYKMHFSMPFDPETGKGVSPIPEGKTYAVIAGKKLYEIMKMNKNVIAITPATPYASSLDDCLEEFPERTKDVGMAEQHALGMAAGLALSGKIPFVFYQSTFMQRVFDQLIHDICFMDLPVTVFAVRSGFAGFDSPTHHGIYDISYLRSLPRIKIFYPGTSLDLETIMEQRAKNPKGPMIVLYPYENILKNEADFKDKSGNIKKSQIITNGKDGFILSIGSTIGTALELKDLLIRNKLEFGIVNIRWLKPIPERQIISILKNVKKVVTTEENILSGGFGSIIAELVVDYNLNCDLLRSAITHDFVKPGNKEDLIKETKIDSASIFEKMKQRWTELFK